MRAVLALILGLGVAPAAPSTVLIPTSGRADRPVVSADGRFVAYDSQGQVFVFDRQTGSTELVSVDAAGNQGNGASYFPAVSGRYVAFMSEATNLVRGDTNGTIDIFVRDRVAATTRRVSVSNSGKQGNSFSELPQISPGGRFVVFTSFATNLVRGDTNGVRDVFVYDLARQRIRRITSDADGDHDPGGISADGRFVGYTTEFNDIGTAYVKDLHTGRVEFVGSDMVEMSLSANGRRATFDGSTGQIYVRDLDTRTTELVTVNVNGQPSSGSASHGAISPNGRFVGFVSNGQDLPGGWQPTNGVFVRDLAAGATFKASIDPSGNVLQDWSGVGGVCDTGVTFTNGDNLFLRTF